MTWLDMVGVPLLARLCLIVIFPFSTLDKILNYKNAVAQARDCGIARVVPAPLLLAAGCVVEIAGSLCVVLAWHDRLAAFILAGYCVVTALLFHAFWTYGDFFTRAADSKGRAHFWDFLKNFSLAGGLILLTLMPRMLPASAVVAHPLSSVPFIAQENAP